jgi:hypothetical protein
MKNVARNHFPGNGAGPFDQGLSPNDRRLLLRSSLRLFLRRLSHNVAIRRADLERLVPYGDDSAPEART